MLLTRAPVAGGRPKPPPLPRDLHVLGLPLAFILSQDQTLRCLYITIFRSSVSFSLSVPAAFLIPAELLTPVLHTGVTALTGLGTHGMPQGLLRGIRPDFSGLSPCDGQVAYVLLTRAPVAGTLTEVRARCPSTGMC